ncbi:Sigma-54 dependent transcriptional regulator [Pseudomonas savastanoi pv. nerii]|uniref:Sigma-54 dependent transcriptional regulator n=1 Tax=Pseudomonas savastanoi pv. nerii TaxID=360921 RepID=A0AB74BC64_PSESS|nr:Sigma-54 dependent transcriptional regulator [Pseudomonas savastanoi pv. savastanoi]RML80088.1 Sigma-54 dependent transcriptional regulator [Pseudomonas savastanoi pv. savastanoi]RML99331.1 hypothetical protein ALQ88_200010 [Pseudomonas savastanoi]RMT70285.1 Sigma-54 dependent transcriptional regulator [Pseudomonas savastanoi pv. nerii]
MRIPHCELPDHSVSTEHFLPRGDSSQPDASGSPTAEELTGCLFFSPDDGRIWLNDQRMLLLHSTPHRSAPCAARSSSVWGRSRHAECSPVPVICLARATPG